MMATEKSKYAFRMISIGVLFFISGGFAKIMCPEMVNIEQGNNAIVSCNFTGKEIVSVYWYSGDPAFRSPILRLENGKPGGTEYGTGQYNISGNGAMIIKNATILHESVYTLLIYFSDQTKDSRHIKINITISPLPSCPVIDVCVPCEECRLVVNDTGKLTCSISGVRPVIPLKWVIITENGVNIIEHPPVVATDLTSDTWYTSAEILYALSSCGKEAELQCVAQDRLTILENAKASVSIYTGNCTDDRTAAHSAGISTTFISIMLVGIVVTSSVIFMVCLFINRGRNNSNRRKGLDSASYDEQQPLSPQEAIHDDVQELIRQLRSKYEASKLLNPKSLKEPTEEIELNLDCHCEVKLTNGAVSVTSTDELLTSRGIRNENRVLIAGIPLYWQTMFTRKFVRNWTQNSVKENVILFYISKRKVNVSMKLINFLQQEMSINAKFLVKGLETSNCILLFDGLRHIVFDDSNHSNESSDGNQSLSNLTLLDLFKRSENKNGSEIKIWINSYNVDAINSIFLWPYVTVYTKHVDKAQFEDFMEKICVKFFDSSGQLVLKGKLKTSNYKGDNESPECKDDCENGEMNKHFKCTRIDIFRNFVQIQQVYEDFKETPFLLSCVVHVMIKEYLSKTSETYVIENTTKEEIICKLIDSLQRAYFGKQENEDTNKVSNIATSLGKLAVQLIQSQENCSSALCDDDIDLSLEKGLLQYSKDISKPNQPEKSSSKCVHFSHVHFKYYFAAINIVQNKQYYTEALPKFQVPERHSVLKFLVHLENSSIKHLFEALREFGMDDDVIDSFEKWRNQDEVTPLIAELHGKEIKVSRLDNVNHREAFRSFCSRCTNTKVELTSLTINGGFSVSFLASLQLPINNTLTVCNVQMEEEEFLGIVRCLSEKDIVLRFLKCHLPETWSDEFKRNLRAFESVKVHTIRGDDETDNRVLSFNYKTVAWETKQPSVGKILTSKLALPFNTMKKVADALE